MNKYYLSVVIPCYNEERNIRLGALENVASYLNRQKYNWEVIVVDDGSTDDSIKLLNRFIEGKNNFKLYRVKHRGKAAAVSQGVIKAEGDIVLFSDLDQATPLSEVEKLLPYFKRNYDVVIGSRNNKRRGAPVSRIAMAKGFMLIRNLILNLGIKDTQCGFKAFKKEAARSIFPRLRVFSLKRLASGSTVTAGFDIEVLYLAKIFEFRIAEVPVEWHYQETRNVNPIKDSIESLVDLLRIRYNSFSGEYQKMIHE